MFGFFKKNEVNEQEFQELFVKYSKTTTDWNSYCRDFRNNQWSFGEMSELENNRQAEQEMLRSFETNGKTRETINLIKAHIKIMSNKMSKDGFTQSSSDDRSYKDTLNDNDPIEMAERIYTCGINHPSCAEYKNYGTDAQKITKKCVTLLIEYFGEAPNVSYEFGSLREMGITYKDLS